MSCFNPHSGKYPVPGGLARGVPPCHRQAVSIPTRGNTLVRNAARSQGKLAAALFQSPLGQTPCSWQFQEDATDSFLLLEFQSPPGETPWSGLQKDVAALQKSKAFQSPLGEIPCSGVDLVQLHHATGLEFQSPLGEIPCSGVVAGLNKDEGLQVSIPTRGNTLFRGSCWFE